MFVGFSRKILPNLITISNGQQYLILTIFYTQVLGLEVIVRVNVEEVPAIMLCSRLINIFNLLISDTNESQITCASWMTSRNLTLRQLDFDVFDDIFTRRDGHYHSSIFLIRPTPQ